MPTRQATQAGNSSRNSSASQYAPNQNVSNAERIVSTLVGGKVALAGLKKFGSMPGLLLTTLGGALIYRGLSGHCSVYQLLGISSRASRKRENDFRAGPTVQIEGAIVIHASPREIYDFWRVENLPRFFTHIDSVYAIDEGRSLWVAQGPCGDCGHWEVEVTEDEPGKSISWRSVPGEEVAAEGSVHLSRRRAGQGTLVRVRLKYDPVAGSRGIGMAELLGEAPEQQLAADLFRLKRLIEAGESHAIDEVSHRHPEQTIIARHAQAAHRHD